MRLYRESFKWNATSKSAAALPLSYLAISFIHSLSTQAANGSVESLSSDIKASKETEKQLSARVGVLTASLQKIEAAFANGDDEKSAAMAALVEQSRRCVDLPASSTIHFFEFFYRGGIASKSLQAMGGEMKRLNNQVRCDGQHARACGDAYVGVRCGFRSAMICAC
jgi:uncharacterized small protein (DUF1192 family)